MVIKHNKSNFDKYLPWIISICIFVLGFLSMFLFSVFYQGDEERNFWFYNAATYGDAICLPGIIISAGLYVKNSEKAIKNYDKRKHIYACHIIALLAGLVGAAIQISWLTGAQSNWTIVNRPNPIVFWGIHFTMMFTGAGVWHAVFFVIAMSTIAYWVFRLFGIRMVLSKSFLSNWNMRILLCIFSFCSTLYMELHFADDLESRVYENAYVNNMGICFAILILCLCIIYIGLPAFYSSPKEIICEVIPFCSGGFFAVSACDWILFHKFDLLMVMSGMLLGLSISWICCYLNSKGEYIIHKGEFVESVLYTSCVYGSLINFCFAHGLRDDSLFTIIITIIVLIVWPYLLHVSFAPKINESYLSPYSEEEKRFNPRFSGFLCSLTIVYVLTFGRSSVKPWALCKITLQNGIFIHENCGSFFQESGGLKNFTIAMGKEWTKGPVFDDFV